MIILLQWIYWKKEMAQSWACVAVLGLQAACGIVAAAISMTTPFAADKAISDLIQANNPHHERVIAIKSE
jgi:hypothetical protein